MNRWSFLRWLRAGAAGAVTGQEGAGRSERRASFPVSLLVQGLGPAGTAGTVDHDLAVHGPGDVVGLDPAQIIRRVPEPDAAAADAGVFAHVELDDPDLPWRYTPFQERTTADPAAAVLRRQGTLTPWLTLVVVERRPGVSLDYQPGDLLPVLTIGGDAAPDQELPKPDELHAWAHVQVVGDLPADRDGLTTLLDTQPQRTLARLMCPRLLAPATPYLACLVPVFEVGRQAGLGEPVTAGPDERAWQPGATTVRLPVYHSWSFSTGPPGDFEALVRRLRRVRLDQLTDPAGAPLLVGRRPLDVTSPGFGMADRAPGTTVDLLGALRLEADDPLEPPADTGLPQALEAAVDVGDAVAPPVYGRWHAPVPVPRRTGTWPTWLATLNRHPGLRVAAGLGTRVVQDRQEEFMAACWEQVGEILRANQLLRQAQLAVGAGTELHRRHLAPLGSVAVLQVTGPALSRLRSAGDPLRTLWGEIDQTCLPLEALSGPWRRLLRPGGPLVRRVERWAARALDGRSYDTAAPVVQVAAGSRLRPPPAPQPASLVAVMEVDRAGEDPAVAELGDVAGVVAVAQTVASRAVPAPACDPAPVDGLAAVARDGVAPAITVPLRARAQLRLPPGLWDPPDRIDPIMIAPQIDAPMYGALAALGQDWLLPGLEHVPPDSVSALASNQVFVEAFLVGMNHEMGRELLWRGYPTDQRGTVFRHFWDARGATAPPPGDLERIHAWPRLSELGSHPTRAPAAADKFVLLLRGELLRRFPRATILLVPATLQGGATQPGPVNASARLPIFSGRLDPDVTFLGFDVPPDQVRGDDPPTAARPGWFVVFQEQPTEPRLGVSAEPGQVGNDGRYRSWADLGAADLATVGGATIDGRPIGHLDLAATTTQAFLAKAPQAAGVPPWDGRSETLATIFLRRPFRLFLHGSDLLEPVTP